MFLPSPTSTERYICSSGNGSFSYIATNDPRTLMKHAQEPLCKLTLTHLEVWMLRNPSERDNVETLQCHLWIYFTGIIHGWQQYPASLCCWVKTNHKPCTLLCVYIRLVVGWERGVKQEKLQDNDTLKKVKGYQPFWLPVPSLRYPNTSTEIQTRSLDVQSRHFL